MTPIRYAVPYFLLHQARASEFAGRTRNFRDLAYPWKIVETPHINLGVQNQIVQTLAQHFQFRQEDDFIVNHDIKYRVGRNSDENG